MWPFSKRRRRTEVVIPIPEKVDSSGFDRLLRITIENKWLESTSRELVQLWNLCDTASQQDLIATLLPRFTVLYSGDLDKYGHAVAAYILDKWKLPGSSTVISATCDNSSPDGSQSFLQSLKNKFSHASSWGEHCFHNSIAASVYAVTDSTNVVLLDDFIGTGKTIARRLDWYRQAVAKRGVKNLKYFLVGLAAMDAARSRLDSLAVPYTAAIWLNKGITDQLAGAIRKQATADMKALEKKLADEWKGRELSLFNFGYGKSEALFYMQGHNVPNSVFPIFWWPPLKDKGDREVLLRRLSP
jgi:hypothetical protein